MRGLLIKDLKLMKNQKQFFITMFIIAMAFATLYKNMSFGINYVTIMFGVFTVSTISYDAYDNGAAFLFTLPISRRGYVKEKYVFALLSMSFSLAVIGIMSWASIIMRHIDYPAEEFAGALATAFMVTTIMLAFMIPVHLKYGSEKSRIVTFIAVGVIVLGIYMILPMGFFMLSDLETFLRKLTESGPTIIIGIYIAVAGAVLGSSYIISVRVMEKKEF